MDWGKEQRVWQGKAGRERGTVQCAGLCPQQAKGLGGVSNENGRGKGEGAWPYAVCWPMRATAFMLQLCAAVIPRGSSSNTTHLEGGGPAEAGTPQHNHTTGARLERQRCTRKPSEAGRCLQKLKAAEPAPGGPGEGGTTLQQGKGL